jgi:LysM repeat protein
LALLLAAIIVLPGNAIAGGACGGTYVAESGDTVEKIAAKCGTSASAIYAANPGISSKLSTGQSLFVPGSNYGATAVPTYTLIPTPVSYYSNYYIVQPGDTFSGIASRFGLSINALWAANPYIWDINILYVGQSLYIPGSSAVIVTPRSTEEPVPLSYGNVPANAPRGYITLSNKANGDVYVSLQGTTADGTTIIREYPVDGTISEKIPAAWYSYVAWVGGLKFEGGFHLGGGSEHTITFYAKKVVVE